MLNLQNLILVIMKNKTIYFIYDSSCSDCKRMKALLEKYAKPLTIEIVELNADADESVDFAVKNGIQDIPACKIGSVIIEGSSFTESQIKNAIAEFQKN